MDGRGGCCIARYNGGAYDMSNVDRIMLRFRPIAPKPTTGGSVPGGSKPENTDVYVRTGRPKRRYVSRNTKKRNNNNKTRKLSPNKTDPQSKTTFRGSVSSGETTAVTLPLLPEKPDLLPPSENHDLSDVGRVAVVPDQSAVIVPLPQPVRMVGSCVTVESVTNTWLEGEGLGCTDEERLMNLKRDTCPGFISNGLNRVYWANKAYRDMVGQVDGAMMMVWLVTKEWVSVPVTYPAFTCRVRVVTCGKERSSLTLPCDVWRMDSGDFAWRLDVKAALSLGR